jgi:hypothetical protein
MFATLLGWLGNLLGGPFAKAAVDAYRAKLSSENTSEKIAADLAVRELGVEQRERELSTQTVIAEQGRWFTALPRPLFAFAFVIYVWKVVVWDRVLGLGTTDALGGDVAQWAMIVLTAYFGGRSIRPCGPPHSPHSLWRFRWTSLKPLPRVIPAGPFYPSRFLKPLCARSSSVRRVRRRPAICSRGGSMPWRASASKILKFC